MEDLRITWSVIWGMLSSSARSVTERWSDDEGASAVEYALIAGLIAAVIITALTDTGTSVRSLFETIVSSMPGGGG